MRNQILFVFLVLARRRRCVLCFNVTTSPTAEWTAQEIVEACPWELLAKYLLRNRDEIYGDVFPKRVCNIGTHLSLEMDCPEHREVQDSGRVIQVPAVGGLHHHYERRAA